MFNKTKDVLTGYKSFAIKGDIFGLAVGVIIGNAFNKIVTALVTDILTPLLSIFIGHVNLTALVLQINPHFEGMAPIKISYGDFLQAVLDFLIVSFSIYIMIRLLSKLHKKEEAEQAASATRAETLLEEIRDLLRQQNAAQAPASLSDAPDELDDKH